MLGTYNVPVSMMHVFYYTFNPPKKSVRSEVLLFPFSDEETEVKLTCPIFQTSKWWNWDMNSI